MLPRASTGENCSFTDALFTATSATCVTGLIVKDTGSDYLRESVAMQDLLSARTIGRIGNMIFFILVGTIVIEAIGAVCMFTMWDDVPGRINNVQQQWFCSIFHSISAFCNAGFSLFSDSFISYNKSWGIYTVICPLIILGGLGFSVLYDLAGLAVDRIKSLCRTILQGRYRVFMNIPAPRPMQLQTKIVLSVSAFLIVAGTLAILLLGHFTVDSTSEGNVGLLDALFQSVTARTAGFNTVDISALSPAARMIVILLMFVGGSPGSTAGGIKTVTLAVIIMTTITALRKRQEVEMFRRSIRIVVVGRAITVTLLFIAVLFVGAFALSITERSSGISMSDVMFETASALGTVGLSTLTTEQTAALTIGGKLIIIATMLIGRLGPLTLLAALTFNLKPARYNYPDEAVIVG
jgi:trk system potassium uptake protein TrkH